MEHMEDNIKKGPEVRGKKLPVLPKCMFPNTTAS